MQGGGTQIEFGRLLEQRKLSYKSAKNKVARAHMTDTNEEGATQKENCGNLGEKLLSTELNTKSKYENSMSKDGERSTWKGFKGTVTNAHIAWQIVPSPTNQTGILNLWVFGKGILKNFFFPQ
jgi:hypothetical protein